MNRIVNNNELTRNLTCMLKICNPIIRFTKYVVVSTQFVATSNWFIGFER